MPRQDPKKEPKKKVSDFYISGQEYRTSENHQDLRDTGESKRDVAGKTLETITRIFQARNSQKLNISEDLIYRLEPIWDHEIAPVLIREFGRNTPLYVIFYQGKYSGEVLMEVWDPLHVDNKSSQVFTIRGVPESEVRYCARSREKAPILNLDNWL